MLCMLSFFNGNYINEEKLIMVQAFCDNDCKKETSVALKYLKTIVLFICKEIYS